MPGILQKIFNRRPPVNWPGIIDIGRCKSGILHSLAAAKNDLKTPDKTLGAIGLASPLAWQILVGDSNSLWSFQQALDKDGRTSPDYFFLQGMTAEIFYGRRGEVRYDVHVSHQLVALIPDITPDGQPTFSLPPLTAEDSVFERLVAEDLASYNAAKQAIYALDSVAGRQVFFGLAGVYAAGMELLDEHLYGALLFLIKEAYQDAFLADLSHVAVIGSQQEHEERRGETLSVSTGRLAKITGRCRPASFDLETAARQ
ncbi:hypothetical protein HZB07_04895 [Candidatus Saganbacteria bacterium]|nr:hypothetical protein [Candidatus Saganbacteria bacterium]